MSAGSRRQFLGAMAGATALAAWRLGGPSVLADPAAPTAQPASSPPAGVQVGPPQPGEDLFAYIRRVRGTFDRTLYKQILGAANEFKEGDQIVGVAAANEDSRLHARQLLEATRLSDIDEQPVHRDALFDLLRETTRGVRAAETARLTLGELKQFLLASDAAAIEALSADLSSDAIGCVVKLMTNEQLVAVGGKLYNPLPGSQIGARGYLGARIQPNSPTDNVDDIRWQVFDGWSYAVGDVLLGTNPVSSQPRSVAAIQRALQDLLATFQIEDVLPHCVLSHIDVQAEVERLDPGSTALWFQSIAGCDTANATFDISLEKLSRYAAERTGRYGLYFETGQGADFTNGHSHGFDMLLHESRKYGLARALKGQVAAALRRGGGQFEPWVHLNDVAGFIGPEVFRSRTQLVRCCLEDLVMGKLHGLCIGLDVCSTLHMDLTLEDLDWCLDQVVPAGPAYLMALPTKIDPMLGYLTTGYQDHVRLRSKFGLRVNDRMWQFFQQLGVIDGEGRPTRHFGDPLWVYLQYCRRKGDDRDDDQILAEGRRQMAEVRGRGLFLAEGHGQREWDLEPGLAQDVQRIYVDARQCIWAEMPAEFVATIPAVRPLATRSANRADYILHPETGEQLRADSLQRLAELRRQQDGRYNLQIVVSDGLNALAITDPGHLHPFLTLVRERLEQDGFRPAPQHLVVTSGRVRAGYRIGEALFGGLPGKRAILHVIGERPGSGHHTFSIYMTAPQGNVWGQAGTVDHNITKVVSGVATTAQQPRVAAAAVARILAGLAAD
ncbi:MAG: ethanolamine ammonia-lyase subunit EutB [Pirellulaceae bacterium]|nr:ethanolamine ammonia-lyase subunit EutB [Pirellulaceae bacterium]